MYRDTQIKKSRSDSFVRPTAKLRHLPAAPDKSPQANDRLLSRRCLIIGDLFASSSLRGGSLSYSPSPPGRGLGGGANHASSRGGELDLRVSRHADKEVAKRLFREADGQAPASTCGSGQVAAGKRPSSFSPQVTIALAEAAALHSWGGVGKRKGVCPQGGDRCFDYGIGRGGLVWCALCPMRPGRQSRGQRNDYPAPTGSTGRTESR